MNTQVTATQETLKIRKRREDGKTAKAVQVAAKLPREQRGTTESDGDRSWTVGSNRAFEHRPVECTHTVPLKPRVSRARIDS